MKHLLHHRETHSQCPLQCARSQTQPTHTFHSFTALALSQAPAASKGLSSTVSPNQARLPLRVSAQESPMTQPASRAAPPPSAGPTARSRSLLCTAKTPARRLASNSPGLPATPTLETSRPRPGRAPTPRSHRPAHPLDRSPFGTLPRDADRSSPPVYAIVHPPA